MMNARRRRWFLVLAALLAAGTLFLTSLEAQIVHQHRSPASAASCPICHLLHRVAVQGIAVQAAARPHPVGRQATPHVLFTRTTPDFSPHSPRAPPVA